MAMDTGEAHRSAGEELSIGLGETLAGQRLGIWVVPWILATYTAHNLLGTVEALLRA